MIDPLTSGPIIWSGKFHAGKDFQCGKNVIVNVAEEVIVGDRCVIPDNAYFCGRRIVIGDDFYGYSWENTRLDIGRGRIDEEDAILTVGSRCTFHNNRLDLSRSIRLGNDVGLSPDVAFYTHGYWLSCLNGYPTRYEPIQIDSGVIIGFRSVVLPGSTLANNIVIGAHSTVSGVLDRPRTVYAGNPIRFIRYLEEMTAQKREIIFNGLMDEYKRTCDYRKIEIPSFRPHFPYVTLRGLCLDLCAQTAEGIEDEITDDFRDFLFKRGIRIYTERPFRKMRRI